MSHSKLGCVYISVKDINRSIEFYGFLLQKEIEIMYINFMFPYYFFMVRDPDGNLIEIAGA